MSAGQAPILPLNAETAALEPVLGKIESIFRANRSNLAAGVILGLGLIAGGLFAAYWIYDREDTRPLEQGDGIAKYGFIVGLGVVAPIGGVVLLLRMRRLLSHRVLVGKNGFADVWRASTEICLWEQIAEIREVLTSESVRIAYIPGAEIKNVDRSFVVIRKDGRTFSFTVNNIKGISRLAFHFEEACAMHHVPWKKIEQ